MKTRPGSISESSPLESYDIFRYLRGLSRKGMSFRGKWIIHLSSVVIAQRGGVSRVLRCLSVRGVFPGSPFEPPGCNRTFKNAEIQGFEGSITTPGARMGSQEKPPSPEYPGNSTTVASRFTRKRGKRMHFGRHCSFARETRLDVFGCSTLCPVRGRH